MQRQGGTAAAAVITGRERSFQHSLRVDWAQDGNFAHPLSVMDHLVDSVSTERALSGSAPAEILLIEGSAAAELRFTLSGEYGGQLLPSVFSPYNRFSPLYGKPLVGAEVEWDLIVETDLGNIVYPQFRGYIRTVTPNRGDNTVSVTALDRVELVRKPIRMANWAASEQAETWGKLESQWAHSHWVIDNALRLCDIGAGRWRPTFQDESGFTDDDSRGVQLFVSGNGSFIPTVGWLENPKSSSFPYPKGAVATTTLPEMTKAAIAIYDRLDSGASIFEDWTWKGAPAVVGVYNEALGDLYDGEWDDRDDGMEFLAEYISTHSGIAPLLPGAFNPMYSSSAPINPDAPVMQPSQQVLSFTGLGAGVNQKLDDQNGYGIIRYWCADKDEIFSNGASWVGFTLVTSGAGGEAYKTIGQTPVVELAHGGNAYAYIDVNAGRVRARLLDKGTSATFTGAWVDIPQGQDYVDIRCIFQLEDTTLGNHGYLYCEAGGNNSGFQDIGIVAATSSDVLKGRVSLYQVLPICDLFVNAGNYSGITSANYDMSIRKPRYPAVLDRGINRLSYLPAAGGRVDGGGIPTATSAWDIITAVAGAEFGSVFFDEAGVFRFWNYNTMLSKQSTIVRELDLDQVSGLQLTNTLDACRNIYTITTNRKRIESTVKIYESSDVDQFLVGSGQTKDFTVFANDVVSVRPYGLVPCDTQNEPPNENIFPAFDETMNHGFCTQYNFPGLGWYEEPIRQQSTTDIRAYMNRNGALTLRIHNGWEITTRRASGGSGDAPQWPDATSTPALRVAGAKVGAGTPMTLTFRNQDSIDKYGPRIMDISGDWMQDSVALTDIVGSLMPRTADPVPVTDAITIAGDPRLQLGDTIAVSDDDNFGTYMRMQILGISRSYSRDEGLTDTLSVEMLRPTADAIDTILVPLPDTDPEPGAIPVLPTDGGTYRRNLCTNPSLSVDSTGWYGPRGARRTTSAEGLPRTTGYLVERSGKAQGPKAKATAGKWYRLSCYIKGLDGESPGQVAASWYTDTGFLTSSDDNDFIVRAGTVRRADSRAVQAPANATQVRLLIDGITSDGVIITGTLYEGPFDTEEQAVLGSYFDGDSPNATWDGTAGSSASILTVQAAPIGGGGGDPDPQPENPTDSAAFTQEWGAPLASSDTFDYTGVPSPLKWTVMGTGGTTGGDECWIGYDGNGRRCVDQIVMNGDYLELHGDSLGDSGGLIHVLDQRYGRWEVRARLTAIGGTGSQYRPTMLLYPQSEVVPELGYYEFAQGAVGDDEVFATLHKPADTDINTQFDSDPVDLSEWHNYGFEWNGTAMIGYLDGVEWYRLEDPTYNSGGPMHLRLQLDNFFGTGMRAASMDIEWARVYSLVQPSTGYGTSGYGSSGYGL